MEWYIPILLYIIPQSRIIHVYNIQETLCIMIILFLIIGSIFEFKLWVKIVLSLIASLITILHYYILWMISIYESIAIYPFIVIETNKLGYSSISIDFGQLMILTIILLWRDKLVPYIKEFMERILKSRGTVNADQV